LNPTTQEPSAGSRPPERDAGARPTEELEAGGPLAAPHRQRCVTLRSVILAAVVVVLIAYWLPVWILFRHTPGNGGGYLPFFAMAGLIILVVVGPLLRRLGISMTAGEKLFVFSALAVGLFSFRASAFIVTVLPSPYNFASTENNFEKEFLREIPPHLVPFSSTEDPKLKSFYRGLQREIPPEAEEDWSISQEGLPLEPIPWKRWAGPLFWWLSLFASVWFGQFCLAGILRKQWLEHETLLVPQAEAALSLVEEKDPQRPWPAIFYNKGFWVGVGISVGIFTLAGFNRYFPAVPTLGLRSLTLAPYLTESPWNAMRPQLTIEPYMVGIAYLLPAQMSLSLWFFAVIDNLTRVFFTATGQQPIVTEAWNSYQINSGSDTVGAVVVFVAVLLYGARRHFWAVVRKALWDAPEVDDSEEFISYRLALLGLVASFGYMMFWSWYAGMSLLVAGFIFGGFFLSLIFLARVVLEAGLVTAGVRHLHPHLRLVHLVGYRPWMVRSFALNAFLWPSLLLDIQPLPLYLTAARVTRGCGGERGRRRQHRLMGVSFLLLLLAAGTIISIRTLQVTYQRGALSGPTGFYNETIWIFNNELIRDIFLKERAHTIDPAHVAAMAGGGTIMAGLLLMRQLFYWWPFHPIGYVAAGLWGGYWFSFFIGWFVKRFVLKYGGGALFRHATPVFLGLVAGQFAMGIIWFIVGLIHGEVSFGVV